LREAIYVVAHKLNLSGDLTKKATSPWGEGRNYWFDSGGALTPL